MAASDPLESGKETERDSSNQASSLVAEAVKSTPAAHEPALNGAAVPSARFSAHGPQAGLQFASEDELDLAIDWLWSVPELRELPRIHVGQNTMVVPAEVVERFRQRGYDFTVCSVVAAGDLASEEVNRIRREG